MRRQARARIVHKTAPAPAQTQPIARAVDHLPQPESQIAPSPFPRPLHDPCPISPARLHLPPSPPTSPRPMPPTLLPSLLQPCSPLRSSASSSARSACPPPSSAPPSPSTAATPSARPISVLPMRPRPPGPPPTPPSSRAVPFRPALRRRAPLLSSHTCLPLTSQRTKL